MNIKSLLLGSAAALVAVSGAQAADAIVAPEPEAVEYVRVCDAYGAGYFYIPGTETCLRISGYVRAQAAVGRDAYSGEKYGYSRITDIDQNGAATEKHKDTYDIFSRFTLRTHTASETELGTLRTYTENRFNFSNGDQGGHTLNFAYMQLGGLRIGLDESAFHTFTGYLGDVMNDDVIDAGQYRTNLISYTFSGGNGFSAIISAEQGGGSFVIMDRDGDYVEHLVGSNWVKTKFSNRIDSYMPHVVGGLKFEQAWGSIAGAVAYDSNLEEWAGKVRLDVNVTDQFSVWVQGGYASYEEAVGMYGSWGGDWAVWGGAKFKATEKATFNVQVAHEDWGKTAVAANVAYQLVPGFTITPELTYTKWKGSHPVRLADDLHKKDAFGGTIRFQRSF